MWRKANFSIHFGRPKIISRFTSFSRLASELPPPTPPSIHYLSPPLALAKSLAYCATLCQAQEWEETQYLKPQTLQRTVEEAFGKKVNYEESYPEVSRVFNWFMILDS